jgi:putative transposase
MSIDPDQFHRCSIRLHAYDYSRGGTYFVTICTAGREMLFGNVRDGAMAMNEFGWIVWEEWERSAELRSELQLEIFEVMPNHVHGLVTIVPSAVESRTEDQPLRMRSRSLSSFIAGFKSSTTRRISEARGTGSIPIWQRNYYERVVRSEAEF